MSDYNFVTNNPEEIRATVLDGISSACGAIYPGDERFIFGEGIAALQVTLNTKFNDQARQRMLRYARGVVLDYLGEFLVVKYNDGVVKRMKNGQFERNSIGQPAGVIRPGYPKEFLEEYVKQTGDRYKMPE